MGVKLTATRDDQARPAIVALAIGEPGRGTDRLRAAELLGAQDRERPTDGLAPYLLARMRLDARDYATAAQHLDRALSRTPAQRGLRAGALRMRMQVACAMGDVSAARGALGSYARDTEVTRARFAIMRRFVARCTQTPVEDLDAFEGGR